MGWDYQFIRQKPCFERILFVLTLDRKKKKERILIGEELEIRFRLEDDGSGDVLLDLTRPLGTLIKDFPHDNDRNWNLYGQKPLYDALHTNRWKQPELEQTASKFFSEQFASGDPVKAYAAFRIWNEYLRTREVREREPASERFLQKMSTLTRSFFTAPPLEFDPGTGKPLRLDLTKRVLGRIPDSDLRLDLWYPPKKLQEECVTAYASFYPLLIYYTNRLADWGLCFCKCKICGNLFLATSLRYELCSDKCRKAQGVQNKRDFDSRARSNQYDQIYKNACQNWRNKIKRAEKTPGYPSDKLEQLHTAFNSFKTEALRRKNEVKNKKSTLHEYTEWIYEQNDILTGLMEG